MKNQYSKVSASPTERHTQNRVIQLFQEKLGYRYLGNWEKRGIMQELLTGKKRLV